VGENVAAHIIGRSLHHYPAGRNLLRTDNGHQGSPLSGPGEHSLYVGVDLIEIERIGLTYSRYPRRFLEKIYTPAEQAYCRGRAPQLASRFAAKEAVMKALGTGVRGVSWRDIEVQRKRGRAPEIVLHDRAKARAERMGIVRIAVSLSHSREFAIASVVAQTADSPVSEARTTQD
jgi:holo-[acyl-carrier protein] synthase